MAGSGGTGMSNPMGNVQQQQGGVKSVLPDLPIPQLPLACVGWFARCRASCSVRLLCMPGALRTCS